MVNMLGYYIVYCVAQNCNCKAAYQRKLNLKFMMALQFRHVYWDMYTIMVPYIYMFNTCVYWMCWIDSRFIGSKRIILCMPQPMRDDVTV